MYRGMDRAALDAAYNNGAAVKDSAQIVADWEARSTRLRAKHTQSMDLRYGKDERNRIDYFAARRDGPVLMFIHGGYWQNRAKELFAFVAEGPLAWGINVALIGYTLAPQKRLDGIVAEIHAAAGWLAQSIPMLGGDPKQLFVSGWSAGGHLTAMAMSHPAVRGGLAISGIYDLEPMRLSYINDKLRLDEDEARRNSPGPTDKPLLIAYGAAELPEMCRQSEDYAALLKTTAQAIPGRNHFTVLDDLASPHGALTALARKLVS
jgi:arylformamidase